MIRFIFAAMVFGIAIGAVHLTHALTLDRIVEYREISLESHRWPESLDGYRIAFLSDIHTMPDEALENVVVELNSHNLDLMLLGGDFSLHYYRYRQSIAILSRVNTKDGTFGVEGNHDDHERLFLVMEEHGMTPLSNSGVQIREGFFLAGLPDLWNRREIVSVYDAVMEAGPEDFVLLLSHNPDVTMQQDTLAVDLVLSGHTHGGQIAFFGIWAPYFSVRRSITDYGQRFMTGWAETRNGVPIYVSRGVGDYYNIPRVFARPQAVMLTMRHGEGVVTNDYSMFILSGFGILFLFLLTWNIFTFLLFRADKLRAEAEKQRISETTLLSYAFFFGGPGALMAMVICRHKTRKLKFKVLVPLWIIVNFAALGLALFTIRRDFVADVIRTLWFW